MKTITINLYSFDELSDKAKEKAKLKWYEHEDFPMLEENLTDSCEYFLEQAGVKFSDISLLYSLSCSQGDGLCFTGTIEKNGIKLKLTHSYRYYFARSVTMYFEDAEGNEMDNDDETLKAIYFDVCAKLEKQGYDEIEYRMTDAEFSEHCEANDYTFEADGTINNG